GSPRRAGADVVDVLGQAQRLKGGLDILEVEPPGSPTTTGRGSRSRGSERLDGEGPRGGGASRLLEGGDEGRGRARQPPGGGRPDGTGGWAREVATPDIRQAPGAKVSRDLPGVLGRAGRLVGELSPADPAADLGEGVLLLCGLRLGPRLVREVVDGGP